MPIDASEMDSLAARDGADIRITQPTYCGKCGYNLCTLPFAYNCPECGNDYNARPLKLKGIFVPPQGGVPVGDAFTSLLCLGIVIVVMRGAFSPPRDTWLFIFGTVFLILGLLFGVKGYKKIQSYVKATMLAGRIERGEA